jgi:hypothetical protein
MLLASVLPSSSCPYTANCATESTPCWRREVGLASDGHRRRRERLHAALFCGYNGDRERNARRGSLQDGNWVGDAVTRK